MSLLLQALQTAAKNRNGNEGESASVDADNGADLTLESLTKPQLGDSVESDPEESLSTASRDQAASVMQANETPSYSALDWVGDHHMLSFLALAALFAIFYGLYVYMQVANPAMFRSAPPPVTAPIQTAAVAPASKPAQISGLPDAGTPETPSAGTQTTTGAGEGASAPSAASVTTDVGVTEPLAGATVAIAKPASIKPVARPKRATRSTRAGSNRTPVRRVDSDGVEIIEIPASPSVSALPRQKNDPGQNISVRKQVAAESQIDAMLLLAYQAMQKGDYQKASTDYSEVLALESGNIDALLGLAAIARKQGRNNDASRHYVRVLELQPRNSYAQAGLIALLGNADPIAAESKLKQLIGREPSGFLYFTLGNLYAEQGKWSRAQHAYFQAYQFQPDNSDYAFNLAVGLEHLGQTRPALKYYRIALDLSFAKGRANFDQGLAIERVGQLSARVD